MGLDRGVGLFAPIRPANTLEWWENGGRGWDRTSDPYDVKVVRPLSYARLRPRMTGSCAGSSCCHCVQQSSHCQPANQIRQFVHKWVVNGDTERLL